MAEEFEFFSTDSNNWNFNIMINNPDHNPFNNNQKLDPFGYNLYKYREGGRERGSRHIPGAMSRSLHFI